MASTGLQWPSRLEEKQQSAKHITGSVAGGRRYAPEGDNDTDKGIFLQPTRLRCDSFSDTPIQRRGGSRRHRYGDEGTTQNLGDRIHAKV